MDSQDGYEQEIDRVLAGLRQVEPEMGMEGRVLQRLAERGETKASSPWMFRLGWSGGLAAAVVVIAFAVQHSGRGVAPRDHDIAARAAAPIAVAPSRSVAVASMPMTKRQPEAEHVQAERAVIQMAQAVQPVQTDAAAASFPAPPMPLTEQERLLVRVAHRGEQGPVTPPPSIANGTEIAEVRADSDKFFQDPTTGENQWKRIVAEQTPAK